jgi:hypothetical protein
MSSDLTLREVQSQADRWVRRYAVVYWEPPPASPTPTGWTCNKSLQP